MKACILIRLNITQVSLPNASVGGLFMVSSQCRGEGLVSILALITFACAPTMEPSHKCVGGGSILA